MAPLYPLYATSRGLERFLWAVLVALPFLHPFAPGPVSNVVSLLVAWAAMAVLMAAWTRVRPQDIALGWALAALLGALIGLVQYFGLAGHAAPWIHAPVYLGDAVGQLRQRNQHATMLSMGMLAVLWHGLEGARLRLLLPTLGLLSVGLAATGSRTGLLQLLLVVGLTLWWVRHRLAQSGQRLRWLAVMVTLLGVYGLASLALPAALAALHGQQVSSAVERMVSAEGCGGRAVLWSNVLHLIGQKPWTGWGWDELRYAHYMADYPGPRFCDILGNAHNLPLHLAFSFGVPVAALLMVGLLALLLRARPWQAVSPDAQLAWGVLAVIGLHSLLEFPLWYGPFQVAVLLALWLLGGHVWLAARWPAAPRLVAVLIAMLVIWVAWDYVRVRQIYLPASQRSMLWRHDPLGAARGSVWFARTGAFAEVTMTPVRVDNAPWMLEESLALLHHSPEPRILTKLIQSAELTGDQALADWHRQQFQAVYPQDYARSPWGQASSASEAPVAR